MVKKYGAIPSPSLNEVHISLQMVATFFEGAGVVMSEELLDINLVQKHSSVELYWRKIEPLVKELRKQSGSLTFWEWFEYLYNEVTRNAKAAESAKTRSRSKIGRLGSARSQSDWFLSTSFIKRKHRTTLHFKGGNKKDE